MEVLESGRGESVKPNDPRLHGNDARFIATPQMALEAAAGVARAAGIPVHILCDSIEGEARDVGKVIAGIALRIPALARHRVGETGRYPRWLGTASRSPLRVCCCRAARQRLPCAGAAEADATQKSHVLSMGEMMPSVDEALKG